MIFQSPGVRVGDFVDVHQGPLVGRWQILNLELQGPQYKGEYKITLRSQICGDSYWEATGRIVETHCVIGFDGNLFLG